MYFKLIENSYIQHNYNTYFFIFMANSKKGILELNDSGSEILSLCDGSNTVESIISILSEKYNEDYNNIKDLVDDFLLPFIDSGLIEKLSTASKRRVIFGSEKYYCPSTITLELTNKCPLECKHCYLGKKENIYIGLKELTKILDEIVELGTFCVQLTGGEALTYPYIEYVIEYLVKQNIQVNISTSGMILDEKTFELIKKISSVGGAVRVSIDGLEDTHNKIRNNNKSFSNAINFIDRITKLGIECQVATCVMDQDEKEIEELCEFISKKGVSKHILELVAIQGNAKENFTVNYSYSNFNEFLKILNDKYRSSNFSVEQPKECSNEINCGAGYKLIKIGADMSVTPCAMMDRKIGDLKENSISEVLQKTSINFSNIISPNDELCCECTLKEKCSKCMVKSLNNKNFIEKCNWFEAQNVFLER